MSDLVRIAAAVACLGSLVGALAALGGCAPAPYYQRSVDLAVQTSDTTNRQMPVAVEVVYVYTPSLVDTLSGFSAREWFRKRPALAWRHPEGFERWRWEWTPGQHIPDRQLPVDYLARAVFVFAGYRSAGAHRGRVPPYRSLQLTLNRTNFQVRPVP